jgi:glycerophosphodiester phosphodiesterase
VHRQHPDYGNPDTDTDADIDADLDARAVHTARVLDGFARVSYPSREDVAERILKVVFDLAGRRAVFFSTFDPQLAVVLRRKQACYPVFLLNCGAPVIDTHSHDVPYHEPAAADPRFAIRFAHDNYLDGIVFSVEVLRADPELVSVAHALDLRVISYGGTAADADQATWQRKLKLDGAILDDMLRLRK